MSKETIYVLWCDGDHEEPVHATAEHRISLDGAAPRLVDLCETHGKFIEDLRPLIAKGMPIDGARPGVKKRRAGGQRTGEKIVTGLLVKCDLCEHSTNSERGMDKHVRRVHNMGRPEARAQAAGQGSLESE